jgi:hypothetical protein
MSITGNVAKDLALAGIRGQYSIGVTTGLLVAGTNGELFQFRWSDLTRIAAIRRVMVAAVACTPFAASPATAPVIQLIKATGWTVQGSGGAIVDVSTGVGQRRTQTPPSLVQSGDMNIATTAGLTGGTKALEARSFARVVGSPLSAASGHVVPPTELIDCESSQLDYPLLLTTNEGFVASMSSNPGTGTMVVSVQVEWMELNG